MPSRTPAVPVRATVVLGLVIIVVFGGWFYGFGVLVEPIRTDTGWAESTLSTAYGAGLLLAGIGATVAGRVLDRIGSRVVFLGAAATSAVGHLTVAAAATPTVFVLTAAVTGGVVGAVGYYTTVHAVLARLTREHRTRAITVNTLWGAFASPVGLPVIGWLVVTVDWRTTVRLIGLVVTLVLLAAALAVPDARQPDAAPAPDLRTSLAISVGRAHLRALLFTGFAGGVTTSVLVYNQVPAMTEAGLALGAATALAGARGLLQLGGRIPLPWVVARAGARRALRGAHLLAGLSCLVLLGAGTVPAALGFAVTAGIAIGALSALESIYAAEIVDARIIGLALGMYSLARGIGASLGPTVGGALATAVDGRWPALVLAATVGTLAAIAVPHRSATAEEDACGSS